MKYQPNSWQDLWENRTTPDLLPNRYCSNWWVHLLQDSKETLGKLLKHLGEKESINTQSHTGLLVATSGPAPGAWPRGATGDRLRADLQGNRSSYRVFLEKPSPVGSPTASHCRDGAGVWVIPCTGISVSHHCSALLLLLWRNFWASATQYLGKSISPGKKFQHIHRQ